MFLQPQPSCVFSHGPDPTCVQPSLSRQSLASTFCGDGGDDDGSDDYHDDNETSRPSLSRYAKGFLRNQLGESVLWLKFLVFEVVYVMNWHPRCEVGRKLEWAATVAKKGQVATS